MRIALLFNQPSVEADSSERDILVQTEAVGRALRRLGHEPKPLGCDLDLQSLRAHLHELRPAVAFNLVESLGGTDRLGPLVPLLLDSLAIPYTGSHSPALLQANSKTSAKRWLRAHQLPTPDWFDRETTAEEAGLAARTPFSPLRIVVKSVWEHASFSLDDEAVVEVDEPAVLDLVIRDRNRTQGWPYLAEAFVEGREFNLSLLAHPNPAPGLQRATLPDVLPPAEIDFSDFPPDKLRIVGQRAKWDEGSFEYHHTPRRFEFPPHDEALLDQLRDLASRCWALFGLRGYARVDFRVDPAGQPWILEVNTNPCLAPDAGFAAALEQAGIPFDVAIDRIVRDALP